MCCDCPSKQPPAGLIELGLEENTRTAYLSTMAEAYPLAEAIVLWMRLLDYPPRDVFAVRLTLLEAVANAIRHGHQGEKGKTVRVRFLLRPDEVVTEVRDQGPGFDPAAVPDPRLDDNLDKTSGRGVFLMCHYSSWVSFNPQGNQVTLCRRRGER